MPHHLLSFLILVIGSLLSLKILAIWSRSRTSAYGLIQDKLAPCPASPNCICSEQPSPKCAPIQFFDEPYSTFNQLKLVINTLEGKIIREKNLYIHATFTTKFWGFVDDFEARLDLEKNCIHLRSSSRVGYSDMGTNAKRIEEIKKYMEM